jgi:REP element-mobilizing transposase RayT
MCLSGIVRNIIYRRRSIRLAGHDYTQDGAYFITLCTHGRECLFGQVVDGVIELSLIGQIVYEEWLRTAEIRPYVTLDSFIIMPNHFHTILFLDGDTSDIRAGLVGATWQVAPTETAHADARPKGPKAHSLGAIIGQFKRITTIRINELNNTSGAKLWQRNYYEHIIRDERELNDTRLYIDTNPARWDEDGENPARLSLDL